MWREIGVLKPRSGDAVIFCDADVLMREDMLETLERALRQNPGSEYAYCAFKFGFKSFPSQPFDADALRRQNYIHTTSLMKREAFPGFDPSIKRLQDWDLWLTMLEEGENGGVCPGNVISCSDRLDKRGDIVLDAVIFIQNPVADFGVHTKGG